MFETPQKRLSGALGASVGAHAGVVAFWFLLIWLMPESVREAILPVQLSRQLVFLAEPGPGGGGGGGNRMPEPPQPAELPEPEEVPVPVIDPEPEPPPEEPPVEQLNIPAHAACRGHRDRAGGHRVERGVGIDGVRRRLRHGRGRRVPASIWAPVAASAAASTGRAVASSTRASFAK